MASMTGQSRVTLATDAIAFQTQAQPHSASLSNASIYDVGKDSSEYHVTSSAEPYDHTLAGEAKRDVRPGRAQMDTGPCTSRLSSLDSGKPDKSVRSKRV